MNNQSATRNPRFAGSWYPSDPDELSQTLHDIYSTLALPPGPASRMILAPHAGISYAGRIAALAFATCTEEVSRVLIIAPSHYHALAPDRLFESTFRQVDAVVSRLNTFRLSELSMPEPEDRFLAVSDLAVADEHALELLLPHVAFRWPQARCCLALCPQLTSVEVALHLAAKVEAALAEPKTLIVMSSDISHYGPRFGDTSLRCTSAGEEFDALRARDMQALQLVCTGQTAGFFEKMENIAPSMCGRYPALLASALAARQGWRGIIAGWDSSLDARPTGPGSSLDNLVTYAALCFA